MIFNNNKILNQLIDSVIVGGGHPSGGYSPGDSYDDGMSSSGGGGNDNDSDPTDYFTMDPPELEIPERSWWNELGAPITDFALSTILPMSTLLNVGVKSVSGKSIGQQLMDRIQQSLINTETDEEAEQIIKTESEKFISEIPDSAFEGSGTSRDNILSEFQSSSSNFFENNSIGSGSYTDPYGPLNPASGSVAAGGAQDNTLLGSANEGISQLEAQREKIKSLYEPYYQSAINEALPQMQALAQGGEIDFTPSRLYEYSKERGERNIRRTQAAKGQLKSSATEEKMSDLRSGLAEEEVDRLYQGQLSRLQLGAGAADAVGSANRSIGGNVSGLYTGLGSDAYLSQQAEGQSRQSSYQGLASSLMGFAEYMEAS